jgi:lysophospholipid acyltransferase (LPLAT)-like uncharacterized protein
MTDAGKKEKRRHSWLDDWFTFHVAPYGIAGICLALCKTWKIAFRGEEHIRRLRDEGKRPIYAFWHERLFALAPAYRRENCTYLSSESRDGEISARANEFIGFTVVRGSASHSGLKALRRLIKHSDAGFDVGITPDGPRGPRRVLKDGAVYLAMKTGLPIVPVTSASTSKWILQSWDRFQVPKPFARVLISLGEPIYLPPKLSRDEREEARQKIERRMIEHIEETDSLVEKLPRGLFSHSRSRPRPWITGRAGKLNNVKRVNL